MTNNHTDTLNVSTGTVTGVAGKRRSIAESLVKLTECDALVNQYRRSGADKDRVEVLEAFSEAATALAIASRSTLVLQALQCLMEEYCKRQNEGSGDATLVVEADRIIISAYETLTAKLPNKA